MHHLHVQKWWCDQKWKGGFCKLFFLFFSLQRFTQYLASSNSTFQLSNFLDKSGVQGVLKIILYPMNFKNAVFFGLSWYCEGPRERNLYDCYIILVRWFVVYWYKNTLRGDTVWICVLKVSEEDDIFRRFNDSVVICKVVELRLLFEVVVPIFFILIIFIKKKLHYHLIWICHK
jgi:hypothetical protein